MAIDFGTKRIGIAVTDPLKMIASALETVEANNIIAFLEGYFNREPVELVVVGDPNSTGRGGDLTKMADDFCKNVKEKFPSLTVERMGEFYTSKLAERTILASGIGKMDRRDKSLVDKVSATILLQNYLDSKKV